jgi:hypothetical protein
MDSSYKRKDYVFSSDITFVDLILGFDGKGKYINKKDIFILIK